MFNAAKPQKKIKCVHMLSSTSFAFEKRVQYQGKRCLQFEKSMMKSIRSLHEF